MSRIYLEVVSDLKSVLKSLFWVSKLDFLTCESGNTEGPSILVTRESGNTEKLTRQGAPAAAGAPAAVVAGGAAVAGGGDGDGDGGGDGDGNGDGGGDEEEVEGRR